MHTSEGSSSAHSRRFRSGSAGMEAPAPLPPPSGAPPPALRAMSAADQEAAIEEKVGKSHPALANRPFRLTPQLHALLELCPRLLTAKRVASVPERICPLVSLSSLNYSRRLNPMICSASIWMIVLKPHSSHPAKSRRLLCAVFRPDPVGFLSSGFKGLVDNCFAKMKVGHEFTCACKCTLSLICLS